MSDYLFPTGMCPKGDDPLTPFTDYRSIIISVNQFYASPTSGAYTFTFNDQSLALPTYQISDQECQSLFELLPNIETVKCGVSKNGRYGGYKVLLQFLTFPSKPYENNLNSHDGNPPLQSFSCDTYGVKTNGAVTCIVEDAVVDQVPGKFNNSLRTFEWK